MAEYCVDDSCSIEELDSSLVTFESIELDLLWINFEVAHRPPSAQFDLPGRFGTLFSLDTPPYSRTMTSTGEPPRSSFTFRFESSDSIIISGFSIIDFAPPEVLAVSFEDVEFRPVPEPTASAPLAVGLAALMAFVRSSRRQFVANREAISRPAGNRECGRGC